MIAPTTQSLERAVRAYVAAGSGLEPRQVRRGNQRGAVPDSLFASVLLIHNAIQGIPATASRLTGDGLSLAVETLATVEDRYSVQWFREGARDAARRFSVWVYSPEGLQSALDAGLTLLRVSDVRQLDEVVSTAWEERAGLDLHIGYTQTIKQTLDYIETVPVHVREGEHIQIVEV